jgi:hypothetical protein
MQSPLPPSTGRPHAGDLRSYLFALALGGLLGTAVLGMASHRPGDAYTALMAVVMIGAAGASFVFAMAGLRPRRPHAATVRGWIATIAAGLLLVLTSPLATLG